MKTIIFYLSLFSLFIFGCKKESVNEIKQSDLMGKWYNNQSQCDSIVFAEDGTAFINGFQYSFQLLNSQICFTSIGTTSNYISISNHDISLYHGVLKLDKLNKLMNATCDSAFVSYSKQIPTKTIIGTWVNQSSGDTLRFPSFSTAVGKGFYTYKRTDTNLTIQYAGPDKLYVLPVTCKYFVDYSKGELIIQNTHSKIYPNIEAGTNIYKRIKSGCN